MRKIFIIISLLGFFGARAQGIKEAEYFFDIDPGVQQGNSISLSDNNGGLSEKLNIPTTSLTPGFHAVYIRTRDQENQWGLYDRASFYKTSFVSASTITKGEYYFDENDPGVGNASELSINTNSGNLSQSFTIPLGNLNNGFHVLNIRTQDNNNKWSLYDRTTFYIKKIVENPELEAVEYFVDSDPGIGMGLSANFTETNNGQMFDAPIASLNLANGEHIFYVRIRDSSGNWSIYDSQAFTVDEVMGIADNIRKILSVYPNPFQDKINFSSEGVDIVRIEIYDTLGKTVCSDLNTKGALDLSYLPSGIYIMHVQTNKGNASYKIHKR
ncbi:T9SS type A sorting domain-containing protein [Leeuwenhoekiella sp. A2]|uniref:T9SS type A sorting domain-containing protein n=1 Tax=Leeuwenhoekiella sp. A2 TaxID=3141460 RepID=UPI003A80A001